jgi:hypothetical protein
MIFPRHLSGLVQESLAGLGLAERLREAEIWRIWPDVVGETLACRARPLRIIGGTLTVAVSSAPWMQELRFMTAMMKEKLNDSLGADVVREIVLKSGRVELPVLEDPEEAVSITPLSHHQKALIAEQAALISDPDTRQALIELMQISMEQQH